MSEVRSAQCRDPRDRIYVAEALTLDDEDRTRPDYSTGWKLVYKRWAEQKAMNSRLSFLNCSSRSSAEKDLPSWVPDWSARNDPDAFELHFAHGGTAARCSIPTTDHLLAAGLEITEVRSVMDFKLPQWPPLSKDIRKALRRIAGEALGMDYEGADLIAFVRAINGRIFRETSDPPNADCFTLKSTTASVNGLLTKERRTLTMHEKRRLTLMMRTSDWYARSFFTASNGRHGLCPAATRVGDRVVVVFGCHLPLILRPNGHGQYRVVGSSYLDGVMSGEVTLDQFPDNFAFVWAFRGGFLWPTYKNMATGQVTFNDPRLPSLTSNWKDVSEENKP